MQGHKPKISKSTKNTEKIAKSFIGKILKANLPHNKLATIVGLYGDLGAGKTTFTQSVAKSFGIKRKVNSPTFVIIKRYPIKHNKFESLFHIDAYRLKSEKELINLEWKEIISSPKHLVLIEWPERVLKSMPKKHHQVHISHTKEGHRNFDLKLKAR